METAEPIMKKYIRISIALLIVFSLAFTAGCGGKSSPEAESSDSVKTTDAGTVSPSTQPPESESESGSEPEFTVELTSDDTTAPEPVESTETDTEIDVFGEYTPPETTGAETVPTTPKPYEPYVPEGSGRAPLALMYHLILDQPFTSLENLFVRPSELRGHIEALLEAGYTFIFADEYTTSDEKTVIMSFDDGYLDNYTEMFPIIKEYNVKVTVFMVTGYIGGDGYLSEAMIREMASSGLVSFQSHTHNHSGLTGLSADSLRYEFSESNRILEDITGRKVKAICYPSGRYNDTVLAVADEFYDFGYTTVSRSSTAGYPLISLPRLRVNRGFSKAYFASIIP